MGVRAGELRERGDDRTILSRFGFSLFWEGLTRVPEQFGEKLLTRSQVAELLGLSLCAIDAWRESQRGPTFIRFSRRPVRYRLTDLRKFIQAHEVNVEER